MHGGTDPIIAGYPARRLQLMFDATQVNVFVVRRLEDYVDTEALLRDPNAPEPPYWAHLWTGSRALARVLATEVECAGRRVVEIGCGIGLSGIVAARRGATVTVTDTALPALQFARAGAVASGCRVRTVQTDVRAPGLRGSFDYVLAADATYDPELQSALGDFVAAHLAPGGLALCTESVRTADEGFRRRCAAHGLEVRERELFEPEDGRRLPVRLTEVRRPTGSASVPESGRQT